MTGEDVIASIRARRISQELRIKQKAIALYATFTKNERTVTSFGMFPHDKMVAAQAELVAEFLANEDHAPDPGEIARLLAVGVMDAANAGPNGLVV